MPVAKRRHPLYLRLTKPIEPLYPDAVTPVAWDEDCPVDKVEGVAYLVTKPCPKLRTWAKQLRKLHRADETYKTEDRISRISAAPVAAGSLRHIGQVDSAIYDEDYSKIRSVRAGVHAHLQTTFLAVILDRADGDAVGFVSFDLKWSVDAALDSKDEVLLEVEPDQAWITPEHRGKRWGEMAAIAIAFAAKKQADALSRAGRWPRGFHAPLKICVGADIYSTSGETFLRLCAEYVSIQFELTDCGRLEMTEIEFEPRW